MNNIDTAERALNLATKIADMRKELQQLEQEFKGLLRGDSEIKNRIILFPSEKKSIAGSLRDYFEEKKDSVITTEEIVHKFSDVSESTLRTTISRLVSAGNVKIVNRGKYMFCS